MYRKIRQKMKQRIRSNTVSCAMTRKVIDLHNQGYVYDFLITVDKIVMCIQDDQHYSNRDLIIRLTDICFDEISKSFKYIHTVETYCGRRGLLVANCICLYPPAEYTPIHPFGFTKSNNSFSRQQPLINQAWL